MCITTKDVIAWGSNEYGQLGHGDSAPDVCSRPYPIKMLHDAMVTQVGGGSSTGWAPANSASRASRSLKS